MPTPREVSVWIRAKDATGAAFKSALGNAKSFSSSVSGVLKGAFATLAAGAVSQYVQAALKDATAARGMWDKLADSVARAGGSFAAAGPAIRATLGALGERSGFDDDDLAGALGNLVTKTGDLRGSLAQIATVIGVARKENLSLEAASDKVAKAMLGQTRTLKEFGITAMSAEDGMRQLEARYAGYVGGPAQVALERMKTNWGDIRQAVGEALLGNTEFAQSLGSLATGLAEVVQWIQRHKTELGDMVAGVIRFAQAVGRFIGWMGAKLAPEFRELQVLVVGAVAGWEYLGHAVKAMVGGTLYHLGLLVQQGGKFLRALGLDVDKAAGAGMTIAGGEMWLAALDNMDLVAAAAKQTIADIRAAATSASTAIAGVSAVAAGQGLDTRGYGTGAAGRAAPSVGTFAPARVRQTQTETATVGPMADAQAMIDAGDALSAPIELTLDEQSLEASIDRLDAAFANVGPQVSLMIGDIVGTAFTDGFGEAANMGLAAIGQMAMEMGQAMIAKGAIMMGLLPALSNPFTSGPALIAAGIALTALGGTLAATMRKGAARGGRGGGAPSAGGFGDNSRRDDDTLNGSGQRNATLVINGGRLDMTDPRQRREFADALTELGNFGNVKVEVR